MENLNKDMTYYLSLPYTIEIVRDNDESNPGWAARVVELPGCITQGDTFEELGEMIEDAMRGWIEIALEEDITIPEPRPQEEFSGKFVVRLPKSLHHELVEIADRENVSLNTFVTTALGKSVGQSYLSIKPIATEVNVSPIVAWPKMSEKARQILILYGFSNEVQEIDEKMFAGWIEDHLFQIRTALDQSDYHTALRYVQNIKQSLELICGQSPVVNTYCQVISLLEEQIKLNTKLREGLIEQNYVKSRISAQTRITTQSYVSLLNETKSSQVIREATDELLGDEDRQGQMWVRRHMEAK